MILLSFKISKNVDYCLGTYRELFFSFVFLYHNSISLIKWRNGCTLFFGIEQGCRSEYGFKSMIFAHFVYKHISDVGLVYCVVQKLSYLCPDRTVRSFLIIVKYFSEICCERRISMQFVPYRDYFIGATSHAHRLSRRGHSYFVKYVTFLLGANTRSENFMPCKNPLR